MDLHRTLELAGVVLKEQKESDEDLKKMWDSFDKETKDAFSNSLKGFMAYRRGDYSTFFKKHHKPEKE